MKITAKVRWSLYAVAGLATAAAMWLVNPRDGDNTVMPVRASSSSGRPAPTADAAAERPTPATSDAIARLKRQIAAAIGHDGIDPFRDGPTAEELRAAAAAQAAAVAAQAVASAQQERAEAAAPLPPPPPPVPPFRYLGHWKDQGRTLAFLQSGDRVVEVRGPGPVDGGPWTVVKLGDDLVTLHMPKGPTHTLSFDAPGSDAPAAAVAGGTPAPAPAPGAPATLARAAQSTTPAQGTPPGSAGPEHAPGWEEN